jgi:hypothetical protein
VKDVPSSKRYFASRDSRETTGSTTFEFLWTFFPPGGLVIATVSENDQLMRIEDCSPPRPYDDKPQEIFCSLYDWIQNTLRKVIYKVTIQRFAGKKHLQGFSCFPVKYRPAMSNETDIFNQFVARGERFWALRANTSLQCNYRGSAWVLEEDRGFTVSVISSLAPATS